MRQWYHNNVLDHRYTLEVYRNAVGGCRYTREGYHNDIEGRRYIYMWRLSQ